MRGEAWESVNCLLWNPFIVSVPLEMLMRNSGNATSRQKSKGLNINCAELFSPPVLLPGTASKVQASRRSPVECSVSITGTSHGAVTRESSGSSPFSGLSAVLTRFNHTQTDIYTGKYTNAHRHLPPPLWGRVGVTFRVINTNTEILYNISEKAGSPKCFSVKY